MSKTHWSPVQTLWEDSEFILSREAPPGGSESLLVLAPASERPSPATVRRLEYLHSLRERLDSAWFARPLAIVSQDGRPALLLEDPGGTVLEQRLDRPLELPLALRVGIGIASALGRFHALGFIHRNLNPSSVFIDFGTGEARLVGAYISPRSTREGSEPPEPVGVSLASLAPEQTGRMNLPTDSRSDLYSFGVMLYRMVTGVLPFKKFLSVPIFAEGRVRGMVTVRHAERRPYQTEEVELAQALAHQVMLTIWLTEVGERSRQAAVLAERNRMARDVHDTLAQGFTGVIVQLEAAEYAIFEGDREDANRHLRQAGELARMSLSEARRSVHALRPQALEEVNFWQALKGMVKSTIVGTLLQTRFGSKR